MPAARAFCFGRDHETEALVSKVLSTAEPIERAYGVGRASSAKTMSGTATPNAAP